VKKCCTARQATDDNKMLLTKHAVYLPDNEGDDTNTHLKYLIFIDSLIFNSV
jgi:hypothetical protein